jgi:arylsulfatase A-like enzyme
MEPTPGVSLQDYRARQPLNPEQVITPQIMKRLENAVDRYDCEVAYADEAVGRILDALDALGVRDRTLVVVTSDHGEGLYAHARYPGAKNAEKHGLYVGHGEHAYEEALHVPLILSGPGFSGPRACEGLVELVDLYPTLLAGAGLAPDPGAHGTLLDRLEDKGKNAVFAFGTRDHALKTESRIKLIYPTHPVEEADRTEKLHLLDDQHRARGPQLFRLDEDPRERRNRASEEPETLQALKRCLEEWQNRYKNALGDTREAPEEMQRRLKGLGYTH